MESHQYSLGCSGKYLGAQWQGRRRGDLFGWWAAVEFSWLLVLYPHPAVARLFTFVMITKQPR